MKEEKLINKPSEPGWVDPYIKEMKHPMGNIVEVLRHLLLGADQEKGGSELECADFYKRWLRSSTG